VIVVKPVRETLAVCALATFLAAFSGSVLFVALPGIGAEFHAGTSQLANFGATLSLGSAIALPLAALADRWRHGPVAALSIAAFSLASLGSALVGGLTELAAARVVAVCFETLVAAVATAAALESVNPGRRGRAASLLAVSAGAGAAVSVFAYPLVAPHWRFLYLAAAPGLVLAPLALRIPGRRALVHGDDGWKLLLRPPWRVRVAVLAFSAVLGALLYEPANLFAVLFGSRTLKLSPAALSAVLVASGIAAACGYVAGGVLSDRFGRRLPGVVLAVTSALVTALAFTGSIPVYVVGNVLWSGSAGAAAPVINAWTAELMPTRARITALTATGVAGALGGAAGLQLVAGLSPGMGLGGTLWLGAGLAVVGSLALLALPETRGLPLSE
jgi:MFS family permease